MQPISGMTEFWTIKCNSAWTSFSGSRLLQTWQKLSEVKLDLQEFHFWMTMSEHVSVSTKQSYYQRLMTAAAAAAATKNSSGSRGGFLKGPSVIPLPVPAVRHSALLDGSVPIRLRERSMWHLWKMKWMMTVRKRRVRRMARDNSFLALALA